MSRTTSVLFLLSLSVGLLACGAPGEGDGASSGPRGLSDENVDGGGDAPSTKTGGGDAGSPNPASRGGPAAPKNGSRIKHQRWQTADGAEISAGLFDTKLGVSCSPKFLTDGELHCVPESVEIDDRGPKWFADDACAEPLARALTDCGGGGVSRKFVTKTKMNGPCATSEVFAVLSKYDAPEISAQYNGISCESSGRSPGSDYYRYDPAKPVAAAELVRFTVGRRDIGGGVAARMYEGEDGSIVPTGDFVNTARASKDCIFTDASAIGSSVRCLPLAAFITTNHFADAECTSALAFGRSDVCERVGSNSNSLDRTVAVDRSIAACGASPLPHVFSLGTTVSTSTIYSKDATTCSGPRPIAPSASLSSLGAEIAADAFPALATTNVGGARIEHVGVVAAAGDVTPIAQLFDAKTKLPCRFLRAADGKMRCLPYADFISGWFRDAACSQPLASVPTPCAAAAASSPKYFTMPSTAECSSARNRVLSLGPPVQPADGKLWFGAPGSCGHYTIPSEERIFELGLEASPDLFAEATQITLP